MNGVVAFVQAGLLAVASTSVVGYGIAAIGPGLGIGFLVAALLIIGFIPLVHARAVRLTMKRLEAITPMSMGEIQADKDQLQKIAEAMYEQLENRPPAPARASDNQVMSRRGS